MAPTFMTPGSRASQFYGAGIIKSTDGGQTWTLLGGSGTSNLFYRASQAHAQRTLKTLPAHLA
jgi:hypothetical protein